MKEFMVGVLVLILMGALSVVGILLFPLFLVLGIFLRIFLGLFLVLFAIWLIGKVTLLLIKPISKKE